MRNYQTIKDVVEQLEFCKYEANEGHPLEKNIAFERLKQIAESNYQPKFHLNEKVIYEGEEHYIRGMKTVTQSHPNTEIIYELSLNYQRESTTNETAVSNINEKDLMTPSEWEKPTIEIMNSVIAEYMGAKLKENGTCSNYSKIALPGHAFTCYDFGTLKVGGYKYHSSLDWLYPVWQKLILESIGTPSKQYKYDNWMKHVEFIFNKFYLGRPISELHEAIYNAIVWLNDNKLNQK